MSKTSEQWTREHDLALLFLSVAYGTDHELSEDELNTIVNSLKEWLPGQDDEKIHELVMEAFSVYLEGDLSSELSNTIQSLEKTLTPDQRQHVLENIMRIAEADGVLLSTEQNLIGLVASTWGLKEIERELLGQSTAHVEVSEGWSLLHDIALLYLIVAHGSDNSLSNAEIQVMIERLSEWQPDLTGEEVRSILREALQGYSEGLETEEIHDTLDSIKRAFSRIQCFAVVNDLVSIAQTDGPLNEHAVSMIRSLADAWDIDIRIENAS
ncbi:tellurite resistance TerB family protein [Rhodocaloribacter sp.]